MTQFANDADASNAGDCTYSASAIRHKIYNYLARSAGTCNWPTDHTIKCFIGMIQTGEATIDDFQAVGGQWIVDQIMQAAEQNKWELYSE